MILSMLFLFSCGGGGGGGSDEGGSNESSQEEIAQKQGQIEDVLYAAFAGSANDGTTFPLYEIMINGFMNLGWMLVYDMVDEIDFSNPLDLFGTNEFTITNDAYTADLTLTVPTKLIAPYAFEGTLNIDMNSVGYPAGLCTFKGTQSGDDLVITFNGYLDGDFNIYVRTLDITASNQFQAIYGGDKTVTYNSWDIDMNIFYGSEDPYAGEEDPFTGQTVSSTSTINYSFLSGSMDNDTRNYTVGGSFALDEGTYTFNSGFSYKQSFNTSKTLLLTSANGKIGVPGLEGVATVKSSFSTTSPSTYNTIASATDSYEWNSGQMTITTSENSVTAAFDNGTVTFSGDLGDWSLDEWQLTLDPLLF